MDSKNAIYSNSRIRYAVYHVADGSSYMNYYDTKFKALLAAMWPKYWKYRTVIEVVEIPKTEVDYSSVT